MRLSHWSGVVLFCQLFFHWCLGGLAVAGVWIFPAPGATHAAYQYGYLSGYASAYGHGQSRNLGSAYSSDATHDVTHVDQIDKRLVCVWFGRTWLCAFLVLFL